MAKKLLITLIIVYIILVIFVPFGKTQDEKGRGIILLTYSAILAASLILKKTNGDGLRFKTPSFQNPLTRERIYKVSAITALITCVIGIILSIFVYKEMNLSYIYDFITSIVILLVIWNVTKLISGKIEQDLDPKLNNRPLKDRTKQ